MPAGDYHWTVTIPADTLAVGVYEIRFDVGIHNQKRIIDEHGALQIHVENLAGLGRRFIAHEGLFRPAWIWNHSVERKA